MLYFGLAASMPSASQHAREVAGLHTHLRKRALEMRIKDHFASASMSHKLYMTYCSAAAGASCLHAGRARLRTRVRTLSRDPATV